MNVRYVLAYYAALLILVAMVFITFLILPDRTYNMQEDFLPNKIHSLEMARRIDAWVKTLLERPIFTPDRSTHEKHARIAADYMSIRLSGIMISPEQKMAVLSFGRNKKQEVLTEGQSAQNAKITIINNDHIILLVEGKLVVLHPTFAARALTNVVSPIISEKAVVTSPQEASETSMFGVPPPG